MASDASDIVEIAPLNPLKETPADLHFDSVFHYVGGNGKWQWRLFIMTSYSMVIVAVGNLSSIFIAATPDYWCRVPELGNSSKEFHEFLVNSNTSLETHGGQCEYSPADVYNFLEQATPPEHENSTIKCTEWEYERSVYKTTIVTDWDLVCGKLWMKSMAQSIFMIGVLIGSIIVSEWSDIYGRRKAAVISAVTLVVTAASAGLAIDYWSFLILRWFSSFFAIGAFLTTYVLHMELVDPDRRGFVGMLFQVPFNLGVMLLPGLSYIARRWRTLQVAIAVLSLVMVLYYWILPESPRWLLQQGRKSEAMDVLMKIGETNRKRTIDKSKIEDILNHTEVKDTRSHSFWSNMKRFLASQAKLYQTPVLRKRSLILVYVYFAVSVTYYGMAFAAESLKLTRASFAISATGDFIAVLLSCFVIDRFSRRAWMRTTFFISAASSLAMLIIPKGSYWLKIAALSVGKASICISFTLAYVISAELYPTCIRNTAVGGSSLWARLGGAVAPYIVDLAGAIHESIPIGLYCLLCTGGGLLIWCLPETRFVPLAETIEEIEEQSAIPVAISVREYDKDTSK